ncbi:hypothetical protein HHL28_16090 [Aerophototrophica crusticola]|uniref:Cysteine biosynthesis protein CysZ n=1 Tax=Aerophototrophica crusticola TaxID=1709002 RepID=A0A858RB45_9PROT|nr:hypothetical protein HHL28_16090 [Rhodospirillaceae bacterium B3]
MIDAFFKAVSQLTDRAFTRVVLLSVLLTVVVFAAVWAGFGYLVTHTALFETPWLDWGVDLLGGAAVIGLSWLAFPAVVVTTSSLMLDSIVEAVERRWYPHLPPGRSQTLAEGLWSSAKFLGLVLLLNLLALPFLFLGPLYPLIFYGLNGYLLGREYYELVAVRRMDARSMKYLRSSESLRLFVAGIIIAFISSIPIVNLLAPVVATAFMVHLFERLRRGLPRTGGA